MKKVLILLAFVVTGASNAYAATNKEKIVVVKCNEVVVNAGGFDLGTRVVINSNADGGVAKEARAYVFQTEGARDLYLNIFTRGKGHHVEFFSKDNQKEYFLSINMKSCSDASKYLTGCTAKLMADFQGATLEADMVCSVFKGKIL